MTETGYVRARSPERKAERRAAILAAAAELLDRAGIEATTLSAIADGAGLAKSNLYRYFESREEILMWLLATDLGAAVGEVDARLMEGGADPVAAVAGAIARTFDARPRLCLLMSRMSSTLEQNLGEERIVGFKLGILAEVGRAAGTLRRVLPDLPPEAAARAAIHVQTLVAGHWPAAHPPPAVARVLERPEFRPFSIPFAAVLEADMATFLRGLLAEAKRA